MSGSMDCFYSYPYNEYVISGSISLAHTIYFQFSCLASAPFMYNAIVGLINGPPPLEGQQGQQGLRLEVLEITSP